MILISKIIYFFLKSSRPSLLIKRAALGNLKASFHCTHWHRFFPLKKAFSKITPSLFTIKEGSTSHPDPLTLRGEGGNRSSSSLGAREKTALLGARNRFAIRLADHQRSSPVFTGWDRLGWSGCCLGEGLLPVGEGYGWG